MYIKIESIQLFDHVNETESKTIYSNVYEM